MARMTTQTYGGERSPHERRDRRRGTPRQRPTESRLDMTGASDRSGSGAGAFSLHPSPVALAGVGTATISQNRLGSRHNEAYGDRRAAAGLRRPQGRSSRSDGHVRRRGGHEVRRAATRRTGVSAQDFSAWAAAHRGLLIALAIVIGVILAFYDPIKNYYVARREGEDLSAINASISEQNDSLSEDVDSLMTQKGVEQEARKLGYVMPNETQNGATDTSDTDSGQDVLTQDDTSSDASDDESDAATSDSSGTKTKKDEAAEEAYNSGSEKTLKDTRTWQIKMLDALFGYQPRTSL